MKSHPEILFLAPCINLHGGIERYTGQMIEACIQAGAKAHAICAFECTRPNNDHFRSRVLFGFRRAQKSILRRLWPRMMQWHIIWTRPPCQLIIAAHLHCLPAALSLAKRHRIPCWVIAYGLESWPPISSRLKHSLRRVDKIISISHFTRDRLIEASGTTKPAVIVPTMVDLRKFYPSPSPRSQGSVVRLLTVGRLEGGTRTKGHEIVLRAISHLLAKKHLPVEYHIVGEGPDRENLEAIIKQLNLGDYVRFHGHLADDELPAAYNSCDIFVMPSPVLKANHSTWTGEGFGIVYIEAAACGKPVIACDVGGQTDCVIHEKTGLLVKPSAASVAAAVERLATSPDIAAQMGMAGRDLVVRNFSREIFIEHWKHLLESLK